MTIDWAQKDRRSPNHQSAFDGYYFRSFLFTFEASVSSVDLNLSHQRSPYRQEVVKDIKERKQKLDRAKYSWPWLSQKQERVRNPRYTVLGCVQQIQLTGDVRNDETFSPLGQHSRKKWFAWSAVRLATRMNAAEVYTFRRTLQLGVKRSKTKAQMI